MSYAVYLVAADGSVRPVEASALLVDTGAARLRIDLSPATPALGGRLNVRVDGVGILKVGPGDASSVCIGVAPSGVAEGDSS